MKSLGPVAVLLACTTLVASSVAAQTLPHIKDARVEPPNTLRGTLVNPLSQALTAWTVEVVDANGRPFTTVMADALLAPNLHVPPKGTRDVVIQPHDVAAKSLVFRAAITVTGMEVGDGRAAFQMLDQRIKWASALDTMLDFLRAVDPSTPGRELSQSLKGIMVKADQLALRDVQARAGSAPATDWIRVTEAVRNQYLAGAIRHGALQERFGANKGGQK